jgi:hypothetical protein
LNEIDSRYSGAWTDGKLVAFLLAVGIDRRDIGLRRSRRKE